MPYHKPTNQSGTGNRRAAVSRASKDSRSSYATYSRTSRPVTQRSYPAPPADVKYFDTSMNQAISSAADWTGTEVPCTNYLQSDGTTLGAYTDSALIPSAIGAGYGQVNNNKYFIKKIRLRGFITGTIFSDQADMGASASVRLVLVMDMQPNGTQAQGENIFTDMGTTFQAQHSFLATAAGSGGRFKILKDKFFTLNPAAAGTDGANTNSFVRTGAHFKFNYNFGKPLQVMLKANSATPNVASLSNCNIFLIAHSDQNSAVVNACARCYYTD